MHKALIVANGEFPKSQHCLKRLAEAEMVVCCDGAIASLCDAGFTPDVIIGDLDSISDELKERFSSILVRCPDQETNDLTKAVNYCLEKSITTLDIIAATGLREDHTIGNISLLTEYLGKGINATMYSDHSVIYAINQSQTIASFPNQKISLFAIDSSTKVSSEGLFYEMNNLLLANWWTATLNSCIGDSFQLHFEKGKNLIVITSY